MRFLSFVSQNLPEILATIAIITALLIPAVEKTEKGSKVLVWMVAGALAICAALFFVKVGFDKQYSLVPNLVGLTYDETIIEIKEAGLESRFVLTSTNDLSSTACRVSWQSLQPNTVANRGANCILILDDNYQVDTAPFFETLNPMKTFFVYMRQEIEGNSDNEFEIILSSTPRSGEGLASLGTITADFSDAEHSRAALLSAFANTLSEAITARVQYGDPAIDINECELYGKLLLNNLPPVRHSLYAPDKSPHWHIWLPSIVPPGNHRLVVDVVKGGECYEFQILVLIEEDNPENVGE